jgi:RimJ/RimL family protein N-acetyltransferase
LGTTLIEKATTTLFKAEKKVQQIVAQIKPGNQASERAFRKAGFVSTHATTVNQKLAHQFILHRFYHGFESAEKTTNRFNVVGRAA